MKYFFDNCISYKYAFMLKALDVGVVPLREQFPQNISDEDLFQQLVGSNYVFLTCDTSQATRALEAQALREAGVTALFLGRFWPRLTFWPQATWLITKWPLIDGFARGAAQGTCAEVKQYGRASPFTL